jgi:hypothetical protein
MRAIRMRAVASNENAHREIGVWNQYLRAVRACVQGARSASVDSRHPVWQKSDAMRPVRAVAVESTSAATVTSRTASESNEHSRHRMSIDEESKRLRRSAGAAGIRKANYFRRSHGPSGSRRRQQGVLR